MTIGMFMLSAWFFGVQIVKDFDNYEYDDTVSYITEIEEEDV